MYVLQSASTSACLMPQTGTIGFFGTFFFVRKIYSVVKVD